MSFLKTNELLQNQDTWKRTQLRFPKTLYEAVDDYSKRNDMSLNTAIISLVDQALSNSLKVQSAPDVKIIHLENGIKRVVFGKLLNTFEIDYKNPNLEALKEDIDYCIHVLQQSRSIKDRLKFFNKNVLVYKGDNHIDIVDNGIGSLNWLTVEDHLTDEYMENIYNIKNDCKTPDADWKHYPHDISSVSSIGINAPVWIYGYKASTHILTNTLAKPKYEVIKANFIPDRNPYPMHLKFEHDNEIYYANYFLLQDEGKKFTLEMPPLPPFDANK